LEQLLIRGQNRLSGNIDINGAKNAALAVLPAVLCAGEACIIDNLPAIDDIHCYIDVLTRLGCRAELVDTHALRVDPTGVGYTVADFDSAKKIRASYYVLGAMLGKFGKAAVALPGGCNFGSRPIDFHIKGFEALGAKVVIEHGIVYCQADELVGAPIYLDFASVGATINILLAAINARGQTVIENAAKEPHVVDVANFLNFIGADIRGAGTNVIRINGLDNGKIKMRGGEYTIIPDMIEAGTFMIAAAITGGDVCVKNIIPKHMHSVSAKLREMNCVVEEDEDSIRVRASELLSPVNVETQVYPGFPTDLQPQACALLSTVQGQSIVRETVFESRFQYVSELERMGARITVSGRQAVVLGVDNLTGADVSATDLRAGMSLITAGLAATGETRLSNINYVDRGYEDIAGRLNSLGADIERISVL